MVESHWLARYTYCHCFLRLSSREWCCGEERREDRRENKRSDGPPPTTAIHPLESLILNSIWSGPSNGPDRRTLPMGSSRVIIPWAVNPDPPRPSPPSATTTPFSCFWSRRFFSPTRFLSCVVIFVDDFPVDPRSLVFASPSPSGNSEGAPRWGLKAWSCSGDAAPTPCNRKAMPGRAQLPRWWLAGGRGLNSGDKGNPGCGGDQTGATEKKATGRMEGIASRSAKCRWGTLWMETVVWWGWEVRPYGHNSTNQRPWNTNVISYTAKFWQSKELC